MNYINMTQAHDKPKDETKYENPMQKLEEGLSLCKFGKFQIILMIVSFMSNIAGSMVTTTSSYVLPIAECDLKMTIIQKGVLNAIPFVGQLGVSIFTGFIADTFGRKKCLVTGYLGMFFCSILQGSSQVYWMLIIGKLLDGIFLGLCNNPSTVIISELTDITVRDRAMLANMLLSSLSLMVVTLSSWIVLPQSWHFVFWGGLFELHSWNLYFYICSIWSLLSAISYYCLPESPKYFLSQGQENEALDVLKTIYNINTGLPRDDFPIKHLNIDVNTKPKNERRDIRTTLINGLKELKPLFCKPLLTNILLLTFLMFVFILSSSTLRLWLPQLSTIIENYQSKYNEAQQFCVIITEYTNELASNISSIDSVTEVEICIPQLSGKETYVNSILHSLIAVLFIFISSFLIPFVNIKIMIFTLLILFTGGTSCVYFTNSSLQMALLISTISGFLLTGIGLVQIIIVRVFPTTLRTITLSIAVTFGRVGSLVGNIMFPILLQVGCMLPFISLTALALCAAFLVYFLPNPQKENSDQGDK